MNRDGRIRGGPMPSWRPWWHAAWLLPLLLVAGVWWAGRPRQPRIADALFQPTRNGAPPVGTPAPGVPVPTCT